MLPVRSEGVRGPLVVMLHWLGGGAQSWEALSRRLSRRGIRCAALDLPGFGEAAAVAGWSVEAMADEVAATVTQLREGDGDTRPWLLAGHSMGAKVAAVVARRSLDGAAGLAGLRGLVLAAGSPPGPEPMDEGKRAQMITELGEDSGEPSTERKQAAKFVDENTGVLPLPDDVRDGAVDGVLRASRTAFRHWLEHGSKEDWRDRVGLLEVPALVFAGSEDEALGAVAQRSEMLPHLPQGRLVTMEGARHLLPIERPGEMSEYVTDFVTDIGLELLTDQSAPGAAFSVLMRSERTSPKTCAVMQERLDARQTWNGRGAAFDTGERHTLRSLVECVAPAAGFDVAAELEHAIGDGKGDGWRFALLPGDAAAWRRGLRSLDAAARREHRVAFVALFPPQQERLLRQAQAGELGRGVLGAMHLGEGAEAFSAKEMQLWFEDVRAACAQAYMSDPRTMERVGFTGFADDLGFTQIRLGEREEFER